MWFVYILESDKGHLYTGITNDLARRIAAHQAGKGAKFTRAFGCKRLLFSEEHTSKSSALKREKQIQSLSRQEKLDLIKR